MGYQWFQDVDHELPRSGNIPYICEREVMGSEFPSRCFTIIFQIDPSKGYKGITCFIATKDMGIKIAKKEEKLGIRASSTCTLNFDDLRIPAENVIGGEGKGYKLAIEILNEGMSFSFSFTGHFSNNRLYRSDRDRGSNAWTCSGRI